MPLYEYYCEPCNGIFEELRPMREASDPVPCPECYKDAKRIMPTSFSAFTFREGYPRRIPDDGKYYHLGKKVSSLVTGGTPNEHPEVNKKEPEPSLTKGEKAELRDAVELAKKDELVDSYGSRIAPETVVQAVSQGRTLKKGTPGL
ncbi:MAG: zinc ribbon domain-containing protein [Dehalococcoidia bacterium]